MVLTKPSWPNYISKESAHYMEAGSSALLSSISLVLAGNFCLSACVFSASLAFFKDTASTEIWHLHSKWRIVTKHNILQ